MKQYTFKIKEKQYQVEIIGMEANLAKVSVNGETYQVEVDQPLKTTKTPTLIRPLAVPSTDSVPAVARTAPPTGAKGTGAIKSPLPGKILDVFVKVGDKVNLGQKIVCLEAMKMENFINSDRPGVITAVRIQKGDAVLEGNMLVEIE